ncbi:MAG: glycosyltransferase [Candidatus Omnitrophota bacterium]
MSECDIIIPVLDNLELTRNCLESVYANIHTPFGLILIDNGSAPETKNYLREFAASHKNVRLMENAENVGWVKAVNQGLKASSSRFMCVMNNDTIVRTGDWISKLIAVAKSGNDIGLVNPFFQAKRMCPECDAPFTEIDFCRGYCVLIKREVLDKIGLWDEAYGIGYYDDHDYSVAAIRAGFRCVRANDVFVEHLGDSTFCALFDDAKRRALHERNKRYFYSKWGRRLNIVFILARRNNNKSVEDILLALARRQHIIYLWNLTGLRLAIKHINIREKVVPPIIFKLLRFISIRLNGLKRESKRYDLIFVNDGPSALDDTANVYHVDAGRDAGRIMEIADKAAKVVG